ncbi:MAG: RHS repeat-associated core domain-containing protein [Candidatus Latescibacteria bacterium]|nr:RHS repeat-associated core domain-containing protein [Candidatus Latescibacterota bacterium]
MVIDGNPITYDTNGNMVNDGTNSYTWNAKNLLVAIDGNGYQYDALGRRVLKNRSDEKIIRYVYSGWQPIQEVWSDGMQKDFIYGKYIDDVITMDSNVSTLCYLQNHQFSVIATANASGYVKEHYEYSPYGKMNILNELGEPSSSSSIANYILYTRRYLDQESGSWYFRYRYFCAMNGRFLSRDPILYKSDDNNLYRICFNNTLIYIDPFGLDEIKIADGWAFATYSYKSDVSIVKYNKGGNSCCISGSRKGKASLNVTYQGTCIFNVSSNKVYIESKDLIAHEQKHIKLDQTFSETRKLGNQTIESCDPEKDVPASVDKQCKQIYSEKIIRIKKLHNEIDKADNMPVSFPDVE